MVIYFGADHRGFNLKEKLKDAIHSQGYEVADMGAKQYNDGDDYPDFAKAVAEKISMNPDGDKGVLICGSGVGMDMAANKFPHVRAALAISEDQVYASRHDDNANVLVIAADYTTEEAAEKFFEVFFSAPFNGDEKYKRRLQKIDEIEFKNFSS